MRSFRSHRLARAVPTVGLLAVALAACNPMTVGLSGTSGAAGCVDVSDTGPVRYSGPDGGHLTVDVSSPDGGTVVDNVAQFDFGGGAAFGARLPANGRLPYVLTLTDGAMFALSVCGTGTAGHRYEARLSVVNISNDLVGDLSATR